MTRTPEENFLGGFPFLKKICKNPKVFLAISEKSAILYLKQTAERRTGGIS